MLRDLEPQLVFLELGPLDRLVAASLLAVSLGASLFGGLAALAMVLAGLGYVRRNLTVRRASL